MIWIGNCRILNCVPSSLYSSLCVDEIIDPLKIIFDQLYNKHLTKLAKYLHMTQIRRNLKLACNTCFLEMYGCFARIWIDRSFLRKFGGHFSKKKNSQTGKTAICNVCAIGEREAFHNKFYNMSILFWRVFKPSIEHLFSIM